ncbi:hypothetical protein [Maridesulfovibrio sp.]|uniref:hypothetical protein n=1 Tax=Maridesulfovibrio sp. TaxID=2795000 RepID=UPI002AA7F1EF|nr:hypothetical protein [Maridesulfovibrio sp.]
MWDQRQTHGLVKVSRFLKGSFLLCLLFVLTDIAFGAEDLDRNATMFLGPPMGQSLTLKGQDGSITSRFCSSVSDGVFYIEERTRLPARKIQLNGINLSKYPADVIKIMKGEKDIVNNYTLRADGPRIVGRSLTFKGEEGVLADFEKQQWTQNGKSNGVEVSIDCKIVKYSKKVILGKLRTLVHVESAYIADGVTYKELAIIASGLWVIYREALSPGAPIVLINLEEDLNFK